MKAKDLKPGDYFIIVDTEEHGIATSTTDPIVVSEDVPYLSLGSNPFKDSAIPIIKIALVESWLTPDTEVAV